MSSASQYKCAVEGCGKPSVKKHPRKAPRLCNAHRHRWYEYGDALGNIRRARICEKHNRRHCGACRKAQWRIQARRRKLLQSISALELDRHFFALTRGLAISMRMSFADHEDMKQAAWIAFLRTGTLKYVRAAANEEARRLKYDQKSHAEGAWKAPRRYFYSLEQLEERNGEYWWRANKQEAA